MNAFLRVSIGAILVSSSAYAGTLKPGVAAAIHSMLPVLKQDSGSWHSKTVKGAFFKDPGQNLGVQIVCTETEKTHGRSPAPIVTLTCQSQDLAVAEEGVASLGWSTFLAALTEEGT